MAKNDPLPEKYRKALSLIEEGKLSYQDVAKTCGISTQNFYNLIEGTCKNKNIQDKFTERFDELNKQIDRDIRKYARSCRKRTFRLIDSFLAKHQDVGKKDKALVSSLTTIANSLGKLTPNVEIGSFSYTKGLSIEDLYAEFQRLNGLASDRGTIQGSVKDGTGKISLPPGPRGAVAEESEDPIL